MRRLGLRFAVIVALAAATPGLAQTAPPPVAATPAPTPAPPTPEITAALTMRADSLLAIFAGGGDATQVFAPAFLTALPEAQVRGIVKQLSDGLGKPLAVASLMPVGGTAARAQIRYEHGLVDLALAIESAAPYRLIGLRMTGVGSDEASLDEIVRELGTFPGTSGVQIAKLGDGAPQMLYALKPDAALAIGSAFKLAILAELIRATNAGERHWDDLVTLGATPLPGGGYTQKSAGTKVPLRELAQKMISVSDNSATDILLLAIGRAKVEAMLPLLGWHDAARNRPYLSTMEMFKLKGVDKGALARRWATLDEAGRRALLDGAVAQTPLTAIDPLLFRDGKPVLIDTLEWFASPADLVRTMDWIRRNTATGAGAEARAILALNPGIAPTTAAKWGYVGYKGGSEPGVIEMTFLLQARSGAWYALAIGWNDPTAAVQDGRLIALAGRAVELLAER